VSRTTRTKEENPTFTNRLRPISPLKRFPLTMWAKVYKI